MSACKPDPSRPHKAIAGALAAGMTAGLAQAPALPLWATLLLTMAGAAATSYAVPNPGQPLPAGGEGAEVD